jgi:hypothetical protein
MVSRELETGTHRLVWNQSVTRSHWLATKLGVTTVVAAAVVGALTLAVSWWSEPIDGALSDTHGALPARLTPVSFAMRGVVPVGYTVFAVVLGAVLGTVLRRSLPAMALTLVLFTVVQIAVPLWVRPHLAPPVREVVAFSMSRLDGIGSSRPGAPDAITLNTGGQGDWVQTNETVNAAGQPATLPRWFADCLPQPSAPQTQGVERVAGESTIAGCLSRLNDAGFRQRIVYQPAENFWRLQWAELGLYLVVSGLLGWFCFWWTRHRLS